MFATIPPPPASSVSATSLGEGRGPGAWAALPCGNDGTRQRALTPAPTLAVAAADNFHLPPVPAGIDGEGTFKKVCEWQVDFTA
jgi:hypothetical protein